MVRVGASSPVMVALRDDVPVLGTVLILKDPLFLPDPGVTLAQFWLDLTRQLVLLVTAISR